MKIEKLNDSQIRCTLNAQDLKERQIGLAEIACGSDKAKALFKDMMKCASENLGFELPHAASLMVELRASSPHDLTITVTRVKDSADWNNFISRFGKSPLGFGNIGPSEAVIFDSGSSGAEKSGNLYKNIPRDMTFKEDAYAGEIRSFRFDTLDDVILAAKQTDLSRAGRNSLFKFGPMGSYQLILHAANRNTAVFDSICDSISEYGLRLSCTPATESYLKEHGTLMIENNALSVLASL